MKINGTVQQRHQKNSIDAKYTVHKTITRLTLHGIVKILSPMNLEPLDVIYTPSHHLVKSDLAEHNKYH